MNFKKYYVEFCFMKCSKLEMRERTFYDIGAGTTKNTDGFGNC